MGAIAELQDTAIRLAMIAANSSHALCWFDIADVAIDEPEVQRRRQQDEKAEDNLFEIHRSTARRCRRRCTSSTVAWA